MTAMAIGRHPCPPSRARKEVAHLGRHGIVLRLAWPGGGIYPRLGLDVCRCLDVLGAPQLVHTLPLLSPCATC